MIEVILADDHPLILNGVRQVLAATTSIRVVAAASTVDEMLACLRSTPCDVLVTDYAMPGSKLGDGLTMLGALRREFPELGIVVLTMLDNPALVQHIVSAGTFSILSKRDDIDELAAAIGRTRPGQVYFSREIRRMTDVAASMALDAELSDTALSERELEVVRLGAAGYSPTEIAARLHRSIKTVSAHKRSAMRKLGVTTDAELYRYASAVGLE